ncbi:hypothetical protein F5884DRAFT_1735 [Xylogone sp. PMI_703]|nr:hypothetical protein F5884DRAFT_1735 [Xylogone sp. PMI_703]
MAKPIPLSVAMTIVALQYTGTICTFFWYSVWEYVELLIPNLLVLLLALFPNLGRCP